MTTLSTTSQEALKNIIEDMQHRQIPVSDNEGGLSNEATTSSTDKELLFEERLGKVMADNEILTNERNDLQTGLKSMHDRLSRLQENNDSLQERLTKAEDNLQQHGYASSEGHSAMKRLELRVQQQEDLIANQELQLSEYQTSLENVQKTADLYHTSHNKLQALQDRFDEMKAERDTLAKRSNTIEKYKQKLQAGHSLEKENAIFREELEETRQKIKELEQSNPEVASLQKVIAEYERTLPKVEQDLRELQVMKQKLELNNVALIQRCEVKDEQHLKDQETIAELMDRAPVLEFPPSPGTVTLVGLQTELDVTNSPGDTVMLDLKAKNHEMAKALATAVSRNAELQRKLDEAQTHHSDLETELTAIYEKKYALDASLTEVLAGKPIESTRIFHNMHDEVKLHKQKALELADEVSGLKRRLRQSLSDLNLVDKDKAEVLEALKKFNSTEVDLQRNENDKLHLRIKHLEKEILEQDNTLRKIHAEKPSASDITEVNRDLQKTLEDIRTATTAGRGEYNGSPLDEYVSGMQARIHEYRGQLHTKQQHNEKQEVELNDLRERLERTEARPQSTAHGLQDPTALNQEIENLKRENRLMASAFHDLSSRLQMSTITLQRRSEAKGFLNRQRLAVNQASAVRSR
ncbi:hypothetical protein MMC19_004516 [Ptychographa xylographoides]|nr:hypothetical protein [Ptychographa xylographoides]